MLRATVTKAVGISLADGKAATRGGMERMEESSCVASGGKKLGSGLTTAAAAAAAAATDGAGAAATAVCIGAVVTVGADSSGATVVGHDVVMIESEMLDDTTLMDRSASDVS